MAYDYKKAFKDLYAPKVKPAFIDVPAMTFAAVAGTGDPNEEGGSYQDALALLYGFSYTVKMAKMGDRQPDGYFDYVVPPLEGLWWSGGEPFDGVGIRDKGTLSWVSLIRQPDFVTPAVFERACAMMAEKKPELAEGLARGDLRLVRFAEGRCAQVMHKGPYDDEPASIAKLAAFVDDAGCRLDIARVEGMEPSQVLDMLDAKSEVPSVRLHHELYLGDPRRTKPESLKTVIRHPVVSC